MSIFRVKKNSNYVVMNRTALNDERLSWKAKGIVAYMLSMPDDWKFYIKEIATHSKDGEDSLRTGIKELKECGYVKRYPIKDEQTKKIIEWETHIYESPQVEKPEQEKPLMEKPQVEKPDVENPTLLSNEELSIELLNIDKPSTDIPYVEIVTYLNEAVGSKYRHSTPKTKEHIKSRWKEGFRLEDFKQVIDIKVKEWLHDSKMNKFLRPETLFSPKFEGYLNQKGAATSGPVKSDYEGYNFDREREPSF